MSSERAALHSILYLGLDVHKDSITIAVLPAAAKTPTRVERLPNDLSTLKRLLDRLARDGELRACYEASGAGYVLHRAIREWGYAGDGIAPSRIPKRPGVQRKPDKRDARDLARLYRAGELTPVRIPTEAEERVRDVVRCRETFQREILKSRHYILKFLARRGLVFRDGTNWCTPHLRWLKPLTTEQSPRSAADRLVFREYHALLEYKLQRRDDLDRAIERVAELPTLAPMVQRLQCFRGIALQGARVLATEIVDWRRCERPTQLAAYLGLVSREDSSGDRERGSRAGIASGDRERGSRAERLDHESRQQSLSPCADPSRLELSPSAGGEHGAQAPAGGATAERDRACVEGAAAAAPAVHPSLVSETTAARRRRRRPRAGGVSLGRHARLLNRSRYSGRRVGGERSRLDRRAACGSRCEHSRGRYADRVSRMRYPRA
jgi:transposase